MKKLSHRGLTKRVKTLIKSVFPRAVTIYRKARPGWREPSLEAVFSDIYRKNSWQDSESVSGRGSTLGRAAAIMYHLPLLLQDLNTRTLLDAACGDFNWMRHTRLEEVNYIGADVVPDLIAENQRLYAREGRTFTVLDITKDKIPTADVILCRDCLIHLSFRHIHNTISNFKGSRCTYLLATTHTSARENIDAPSGGWRCLNLQLPPINFPEPLKLIVEDEELGKSLGVWRLKDL